MKNSKREYSYATKAYQPLVGCQNDLPCWRNCWAHKSVRRIVRCQEKDHPERADFFRQFVTPTGWSGKVALDEKHLLDPLKWRQPQIVASGYHGDVGLLDDASLDRIFAVAALCPQHQFLMLTKRPEKFVEYFDGAPWGQIEYCAKEIAAEHFDSPCADGFAEDCLDIDKIPLQNVWLGASIMTQADADRMLPRLMRLAAAGWKTWASIEPMVGPIDLGRWTEVGLECSVCDWSGIEDDATRVDAPAEDWHFECPKCGDICAHTPMDELLGAEHGLRFVVLGGESGPNARPCDVAWIRDVLRQCGEAQVPCYVKQLGARPGEERDTKGDWHPWILCDRSGSDPAEWPADLRVQQYPPELARIAEGRDA